MPAKKAQKHKTSRKYKSLVFIFISFATLLLIFVVYFSLAKTTIVITPDLKSISQVFLMTVKENPTDQDITGENLISGMIFEKEVIGSKTKTDLGEAKETPSLAQGQVTIHNNWSQSQPLAATTRLLSESGVLFRTKNRVDVPAKGSVETEVVADQPGKAGDISPSKFSIPGLSKELQEKIYAESTKTMTGGIKMIRTISQQSVLALQNELVSALKEQLIADLKNEISEINSDYNLSENNITYEILSKTYSPEIGQESENLSLSLKLKFIAVAFNENDLNIKARENLAGKLNADQVLSTSDFNASFELQNFNLKEKYVNIKVEATGKSQIDALAQIFNKENLYGKNKSQIIKYLLDTLAIKDVRVKFSPFWVTSCPSNDNRIEIEFTI